MTEKIWDEHGLTRKITVPKYYDFVTTCSTLRILLLYYANLSRLSTRGQECCVVTNELIVEADSRLGRRISRWSAEFKVQTQCKNKECYGIVKGWSNLRKFAQLNYGDLQLLKHAKDRWFNIWGDVEKRVARWRIALPYANVWLWCDKKWQEVTELTCGLRKHRIRKDSFVCELPH